MDRAEAKHWAIERREHRGMKARAAGAELRCVLDYETRSRANLKHVSATEYAKHESTSVFCVGYKIDDGVKRLWIPERSPMPPDLWEAFQRGVLVAHSAGFERAITKYTLTRYPCLTSEQRQVLSTLPPSRWRCTAAKAAASSLPRKLEHACHALRLPTQKDLRGHKLILKYSKPRKPSKHNPSHWWGDAADLRAIYRYCLTDVQAEWELDQALPDLSPFEQQVWELDQRINDRGVLIDIPTVKIILGMIREEMGNITKAVRELSGMELDSVAQHAKLLKWVNDRGAGLPNLQAGTIREKLDDKFLNPDVRQMLEYRQSGSKTSTAKYISMVRAVGTDHRARELLLYNGTMPTGRWSGKRIQPQNFPRPTIKDFNSDEAVELIKTGGIRAIRKKYGATKVMDVLVSAIRGMLIASPGCELFCADFAAIELCLTFWVAEHEEGLTAIREGRKMYEEMAAAAFDMNLDWLLTTEGKNSLERFVGKESVLGCGYGMGWRKFLSQCHKKGMKGVTPEIAKKAVYTYRELHAPVPQLWKNLETAAIQAIMHSGRKFHTNKVTVYVSGDWLNIKLPSGRKLRYYRPRLSQKQLAGGRLVPQIHHWAIDHHQWVEVVTWGGVLCNNVIQGIARDLMVSGIFNIEKAGYEFLLSVHDEGLAEKEKGCGTLKEYTKLMTKLPVWAKGAPVKAEGWVGPRYRK